MDNSRYACRSYLRTPLLNRSRSDAETRYNATHRRTRGIIERCFGIRKRRFPCLRPGLRTALRNSVVVVVAIASLHNFAILQREENLDGDDVDDDVPEDPPPGADASGNGNADQILPVVFLKQDTQSYDATLILRWSQKEKRKAKAHSANENSVLFVRQKNIGFDLYSPFFFSLEVNVLFIFFFFSEDSSESNRRSIPI